LATTRWHLRLVDWTAVLRAGTIRVSGPPGRC
jgi:hypothetical protein